MLENILETLILVGAIMLAAGFIMAAARNEHVASTLEAVLGLGGVTVFIASSIALILVNIWRT